MAKKLIGLNADAKNRLDEFASELRKLKHPISPIPIHLAQYVAGAIEEFLSVKKDTANTLEEAFGLTTQARKRGRPSVVSEERNAIVKRCLTLKMENPNLTYEKICKILSEEGLTDNQEESTIRKMVKNMSGDLLPEIVADEIGRELRVEKELERQEVENIRRDKAKRK
jgi:hypothetical protein